MAKRKDVDPKLVEEMLQDQLKLFADHRRVFVECTASGKVYITVHVIDATNDNLWDRILRLFHLMNVELTVSYTHSVDGTGLEATADNMSPYQISILQRFVECNGVLK